MVYSVKETMEVVLLEMPLAAAVAWDEGSRTRQDCREDLRGLRNEERHPTSVSIMKGP